MFSDPALFNTTNLLIYMCVNILLQCIVNISFVNSKCGGKFSSNFASGFFQTIISWLLIFGIMVASLLSFPKMKYIFADVIGYFIVSNSAHKLLTSMLKNSDDIQIESEKSLSDEQKTNLAYTSDLVNKVIGNTGLIINNITPENLEEYWTNLTPIMRPSVLADADNYKNNLKTIVYTRDFIGTISWYVYTGIFVIGFITYRLSTQKCANNGEQMKANYDKFKQAEKEKELEKQKDTTVYKL
jgi:predicted RNA-binding protein YlqC (UPF0109 family)